MKRQLKVSKTSMVKKHLLTKKSITSWEAIEKYKVTRLSAIIHKLREAGWKISNKKLSNENSNFVKYVLVNKN
jgi:hypothetical protein